VTNPVALRSIHPMRIPFPIACLFSPFVSELSTKRQNDFWATASLWLLGIGLIMAALAAGDLSTFFGDHRFRNLSNAWLPAGRR
jgi:uncharacterized membrane protein